MDILNCSKISPWALSLLFQHYINRGKAFYFIEVYKTTTVFIAEFAIVTPLLHNSYKMEFGKPFVCNHRYIVGFPPLSILQFSKDFD